MPWVHKSQLPFFDPLDDSDDDLGFGFGGGARGSRNGGPAPIDVDPDEDDAEIVGAPELEDPGAGTLAHALANPEGGGFGEYSFGGQSSLPAVPGLVIDGVGPVAVPLTDPDVARKIAAAGRLAPFGRDAETVMDTSVRKTWQIDADKIKLTHPNWKAAFDELAKTIANRLGCPQLELQVKLYKGLLYEEGCFFKRHRDTEKEDGMFATLVVQLPSLHMGGELVVWQQDGTTTTVHDFGAASKTAQWGCHYAVHYADAEHELLPVTSGYRLALVYSICYPPAQQPAPADLSVTASANRQRLLSALTHLSNTKTAFHLFLAHQYTHKSMSELGFNALKGHDRARITRIQQANAGLPADAQFWLLISSAARIDEFDCLAHMEEGNDWRAYGPSEWEKSGTNENVAMWQHGPTGTYVDSGGSASAFDNLGELVNPEAKRKADLWKTRKENRVQYTGNEGASLQQIYRKYLMVAIPKRAGIKRLAEIVGVRGAFSVAFNLDAGDTVDGQALAQYLVESRTWNQEQRQKYPSLLHDVRQHEALDVIVKKYVVEAFPAYLEAFACTALPKEVIPLFTRAMREHPQDDWHAKLLPHALPVLEGMADKFAFCLSVIHAAFAAGVSDSTVWMPVLTTMLTPAPTMTRNQLVNADFQTKLWTVVCDLMATQDTLTHVDTIVQAHILANAPQDLATPVTILTAMLPTILARVHHDHAAVSHLLPLFQARCGWLQARTLLGQAQLLQPTWAMPDARFPTNPAVEAFLHSPTEHTLRVSDFASITAARTFVKQYGTPPPDAAYSWTMKEDGRGRGAYVTITKTRAWLGNEAERVQQLVQEVAKVHAAIQQIVGPHPQPQLQPQPQEDGNQQEQEAGTRKRTAGAMLAGDVSGGSAAAAATEPSAKQPRLTMEE